MSLTHELIEFMRKLLSVSVFLNVIDLHKNQQSLKQKNVQEVFLFIFIEVKILLYFRMKFGLSLESKGREKIPSWYLLFISQRVI